MILDFADLNLLNCGLAGIIWLLALWHQDITEV
jgi:hypothetical protein